MTRCLLSTIRTVPLNAAAYLSAWAGLQSLAESMGARAWLFQSAGHTDRYIEFIEWKPADAQRLELDQTLSTAQRALDHFGAGLTEQWLQP